MTKIDPGLTMRGPRFATIRRGLASRSDPSQAPADAAPRPDPMRGHIAAFDGLRGLAILLVLMIHLICCAGGVSPFTTDYRLYRIAISGWCGVTLFFVLSGFLITGILHDSKGSPHWMRIFYARRALRIFPLYYGALALVYLVLPAVAPAWSVTFAQPPREQLWAWLYAVNWAHIAEAGNFYRILHFWSLAVEEHFYLVWPFVIWFCGRRGAIGVCAACISFSTVARALMASRGMHPSAVWMYDFSHLDSLALGALIALLVRGPRGSAPLVWPARFVALASAAVVGTLVYRFGGMSHMSPEFLAYGMPPLVAFFGAALVLVAYAPRTSPLGLLFNLHSLQLLGKYSYGIYVWHWLLMPVFDAIFPIWHYEAVLGSRTQAILLHAALSAMASVAVAVISYHMFEKHFLKIKDYFFANTVGGARDGRAKVRPDLQVLEPTGVMPHLVEPPGRAQQHR